MYGLVVPPEPRNKNWVQRTETTGLWYYVSVFNPTPWEADEGWKATPPKVIEPPPTVVKPDPGLVQLWPAQPNAAARKAFLEATGKVFVEQDESRVIEDDGIVSDSFTGVYKIPDHSLTNADGTKRDWKIIAQALADAGEEAKNYKVQVYTEIVRGGLSNLLHYNKSAPLIITGPRYRREHDAELVFGSIRTGWQRGSEILTTEIKNWIHARTPPA